MLSSKPRASRLLIVLSLAAILLLLLQNRGWLAQADVTKFINQQESAGNQRQDVERLARKASESSSAFVSWTEDYLTARNPDLSLSRGLQLAEARRQDLKSLILIDPATALSLAVTRDVKQKMPREIQEKIEEHISAYGDYIVVVSDEIDRASGAFIRSHVERTVVIDGKNYKAGVYGRWLGMTSKKNIPINGIIIDDMIAVNESPVKILSPDELAKLSSMRTVGEGEIVVDIGGEIQYFKDERDLSAFLEALVSRERMIGPYTEEHKGRALAEVADGRTADSSWTEGQKTVLIMRVDFSDKPGEPVDSSNQTFTISRAQNLINSEVSPFYVNSSYNKTSQQVTVTPVIRLPSTLAFYEQGNNYSVMLTDARNAARAAGFETNNFNLDIVAFSYSQNMNWAGRGAVGGKGTWLNGAFNLRVTAHELGHNYGLWHANLWRTTDGSVIGNGDNVEYGDPFDQMGGGGDAKSHFNARYKRLLDWLTDANTQTVTSDGVYRVAAHDSSTPGGIRVLKVRKNSAKNYWIEFRQLFTSNSNAMNGAIVHWDYPHGGVPGGIPETQILDMTPNTSTTATDAPLLIGQTFNDNEDRIRMTVVGKGNTTPESLDLRVELNVGCTFSLGQTSQNFSASGGEGSIPVNTLSGCRPPATSNASWLYPIAGDSSQVRYIVAANYESQARIGNITIAGQTFTVQQAGATTACVPKPSGLVAWWRGEGNALDQTGVNNGTLTNNMSFGGGRVGGGFLGDYSNNGGSVEVSDATSLALYRSMTFEGWLKVSSFGGTLIARGSSDPFARSYEVYLSSSGQLSFIVWYTGNSGTGISSDPLALNQFVHFATSLDDTTGQITMYINGSLVRQFTITQRPYVLANAKINIGNINGITDELSVYNRALTASEVQTIYNAGIANAGATGKCLTSTCPTITGLSTLVARVGDTVTINGSGFLDATSVKFSNNVGAGFTIISDSQITTTVPAGAVTGPITISKVNCSDVQSSSITIDRCPSINSLSASIAGVGQTITINGIGFLSVTGVKFSNNVTASFSIINETQITAVVPSGSTTGPITLIKNNCANGVSNSITICPTAPVTLTVDDGHAETSFGFGTGTSNSLWVNRLTPSSYPATLTAVLPNINLPSGTNVNIVVGANPGGTSSINNTISQTIATTVSARNAFTYYSISPITINSGDFVVGYSFVPVTGFFPANLDTTPPSQGRSYYSTNGTSFVAFDSFNPGNLLIRAEVFPGTCPSPVPSAPTASAATSVTSSGFTANWSSSSGATGYRLDVSTNNSFSSFVSGYQDLDVGNVLSRGVSGLSAGTNYYYRLRAYNSGGTGSNSNIIGVTTAPSPVILLEQGTTNGAAALDAITWVRGPFKVLNFFNFTADNHTRVMLFTSDLGMTQPDASQLTVRAGGVTLTVEGVGPVTGVTGMNASYIIVRLPDGLPAGDLPLIVTLRGLASVNSPTLAIASSGP